MATAGGSLLGLASWPSAAAATSAIYVGGAGCSDANTGTQASPVCTIAKGVALAAVASGTAVAVNPGTYSEQVTVPASGTAAQPFTIAAVTPGTVTVKGGAHGFVVIGRSYVTIDGFTVSTTTAEGFVLASSDHLTITRDTVAGAGAQLPGRNVAGTR